MGSKLIKILIYLVVLVFSIICLMPFIMVLTGSVSNEQDIYKYGYTLIPKHFDLISYRILLLDIGTIANAYKISIIVTVAGTFISLLVNTMLAYVISRRTLKYRKVISVYALITILFNGGMVPWYIVCVNYLHLKDTLFALILPYIANAWYVFLLRNYLQTIPEEMHESAKIDGAGEYTIFFKIILRLMTPALATVGLFTALLYWNDWWLGLMLIDKTQLQPLQLLLRTIVSNIMFLKASTNAAAMQAIIATLPSEGIKMAICVITIGPIVFLYPFLQKYFVKGIMIGAVKG
jgi:putative aldouronate transport system permease protein